MAEESDFNYTGQHLDFCHDGEGILHILLREWRVYNEIAVV